MVEEIHLGVEQLTPAQLRLLCSYEHDGSDVVPVEHTSRGTMLLFTTEQIEAIKMLGFYAMTPGSTALLAESLKLRGN